jgi:hypothetical protein
MMKIAFISMSRLSVATLAVMFLAIRPVEAAIITAVTPLGAVSSDGQPVDAMATFVTGAGSITITLENLIENPKAVSQNLSDLTFEIGTHFSTATLLSSSGKLRTVASNKSFADGNVVATGWSALVLSGDVVRLSVLGTAIGPAHTVIGSPSAADNLYDAANSSITGKPGKKDPHNPFLAGPVMFDLSVPGVTADTLISDVRFAFGTTAGDEIRGDLDVPPAVPEPASLLVWTVFGLVGAGLVSRRKAR